MNKKKNVYEPPKMKAYQFDEETVLTASSGGGISGDPTNPTADYAANALNQYMGGTNTTLEK